MKRTLLLVSLFASLCLVGMSAISISADAAPPPPPEGRNIVSGEELTMVQMVAEEVLIDVGASKDTIISGDHTMEGYVVAINCTFWMVNQGEELEQMKVRFPIHAPEEIGTISIQSIKVDGKPVEWVEDEFDQDLMWDDFIWAHFDVSFPVGEEVEIKVAYTTISKSGMGDRAERVNYILETGAGWYGEIGEGKIILRLPYRATSENVDISSDYVNLTFTDSDVYYEFTELEPSPWNNYVVDFVAPDDWKQLEADREKLETSPNNTSALMRIAELAYGLSVNDRSGEQTYFPELFEEGVAAIEGAVNMLPGSIEYHELYAQYLAADLTDERVPLLEEELALLKESDIENVLLIEIITSKLNHYDDAQATETAASFSPTPSRTSTPVPSATIQPSYTYVPTVTQEETPTPRRATHTPEPTLGAEETPAATDETVDEGRTGRIIAWAVLLVLMLVNIILGRIQKSKRK